jgi:hypothetical protein
MRVRPKERCLLPSGYRADLTEAGVVRRCGFQHECTIAIYFKIGTGIVNQAAISFFSQCV